MSEVMGREKVLQLLNEVLGYATADQTEVSFSGDRNSLTRFANNYIHQNVSETNTTVRIRSIFGQKIGSATTNKLDAESLKATVVMAEQLARLQVDDPDFKSLPGPELGLGARTTEEADEATYFSDPQVRAAGAGAVCRRAQEAGFTAAGAFETVGQESAVVNSLGLNSYFRGAHAHLNMVVMGENSSGWAERVSPRIGDIDYEALAQEAVDKAVRGQNPISLDPGDYEVILEEYAVAEMLNYMSYLGMGALAVQEDRSFMHLGQKIVSPLITIYDDGNDPHTVKTPFDAEGVQRQRVNLIEAGVAQAVVYDTYTANKEGGLHTTTGHSIGEHSDTGPIPLNLVMAAGDTNKAEMLKSIKRGLWVTRFHYVNPLVPDKAVLTGMTRDGTFLIENGEIVGPVKNFRFTQSAVEALNNVISVGSHRVLLPSFGGGSLVPALHCRQFTFNSATAF